MYFNEFQQIVSAATASATFTTDLPLLNFDNGAVQVVWTNHNAAGATFRLQASIDGSNFSNLTSTPTTMVSGTSSQLYNITDLGYKTIRAVYDAGSNTAGTIDVWYSKKSRR